MKAKSLKQYEKEVTQAQVNRARRILDVVLDSHISQHAFTGSLEKVMDEIESYRSRFEDQYQDMRLELRLPERDEGLYEDLIYSLRGKRLETDDEVITRLAKRKQAQLRRSKSKQEQAEREKEQIKKLLKKHGLKLEFESGEESK